MTFKKAYILKKFMIFCYFDNVKNFKHFNILKCFKFWIVLQIQKTEDVLLNFEEFLKSNNFENLLFFLF